MWPIQGCATGQGMVFGLSVLHRVYNFVQVCPKQVRSVQLPLLYNWLIVKTILQS